MLPFSLSHYFYGFISSRFKSKDFFVKKVDFFSPTIKINQKKRKFSFKLTEKDRLEYFLSLNKRDFTRKDYIKMFKDISAATASRDLKKGVELKFFKKLGDKNKTNYLQSKNNK